MKNHFLKIPALAILTSFGCGFAFGADATKPSAVNSVFVMPASSKDGRDPFFPESTRTFETRVVTSNVFDVSSLKYIGHSGAPGHLFAIINNHTFAVGDEGNVITSSGRVHIRCMEVGLGSVTLEINGQLHRLKLEDR